MTGGVCLIVSKITWQGVLNSVSAFLVVFIFIRRIGELP